MSSLAKTEGTTHTYGHLIYIPSRGDVSLTNVHSGHTPATAPTDISVQILLPADNPSRVLTDDDKAKILVSAFSERPHVVSLTEDISRTSVGGPHKQPPVATTQNVIQDTAIILGSVHKTKAELQKIFLEANKANLSITLKSSNSEELEFVNLQEVNDLQANFTYNFFSSSGDWSELDINIQEDQAKDPLLHHKLYDVPMYVELSWTPVHVLEPLSEEEMTEYSPEAKKEIDTMKVKAFRVSQGVTNLNSNVNMKDPYSAHQKKKSPLKREGIDMNVIDLHHLDVAINSTSNKHVFANTINVVFDTTDNTNSVTSLPVQGSVAKIIPPGRSGQPGHPPSTVLPPLPRGPKNV
jgi:hypothetical protein